MGCAELQQFLLASGDSETVRRDRRYAAILERLLVCRTEALGGRLFNCSGCGAQVVFYNPCNQRGCPSCAQHVQPQWRKNLETRLLDTAHDHIVFSAPAVLTSAWQAEPRAVIDALFAAARQTFAIERKRSGLQFGITIVFHSHAAALAFKPHLHCIVTTGGLDRNGAWRSDHRVCERTLRSDFRRRMLAETAKRLPAQRTAALHNEAAEAWRVYAVRHPDSPRALLGYFARSRHGVAVDLARGLSIAEDSVSFVAEHHGERRRTTLSREEFLRRYFAHIPPRGTVTVRHYGLYATRAAGLLERIRGAAESEHPRPEHAQEADTAERCPLCNTPLTARVQFASDQLPPVLQLLRRSRGSPACHGELIQHSSLSA